MHRVAHFGRQQTDNLPVALHISGGVDGFFKPLEATVGTGEDAAVFAP